MPTLLQLVRYNKLKRLKKYHKVRTVMLRGCPQKRATCIRLFTASPRKPNSANRRVARITVESIKKATTAHVPGIGHNLRKFSRVIIHGKRVRDIPGIQYRIVRGLKDAAVLIKYKGASKYGFSPMHPGRRRRRRNMGRMIEANVSMFEYFCEDFLIHWDGTLD